MDETATRLETAALARNLLFLAWREFAELQEKIMNGREKICEHN